MEPLISSVQFIFKTFIKKAFKEGVAGVICHRISLITNIHFVVFKFLSRSFCMHFGLHVKEKEISTR